MTNAGIKAILKDKAPSTKWLQFYLNVYLYVAIVFAAISVPGAMIGSLKVGRWIVEGDVLELAMFLVRTFTAAASIVTFLQMRKLTMLGYKWNLAMLYGGFVG